MAELKIFLDKALIFLYNILIENQKLSIFFKANDMDLTNLQYTDAELVELAEQAGLSRTMLESPHLYAQLTRHIFLE